MICMEENGDVAADKQFWPIFIATPFQADTHTLVFKEGLCLSAADTLLYY